MTADKGTLLTPAHRILTLTSIEGQRRRLNLAGTKRFSAGLSIRAGWRVVQASRKKQLNTISKEEADKYKQQEGTMRTSRIISIWTVGAVTAAVLWLGLTGTAASAAAKPEANANAAFAKIKS